VLEAAKRLAERSAGAAPSTSIVICTRDRPEELARCLASLPEQSLSPGEIIVIDNASRDGRTREVALAAGVTYVREDRPGLDFARNAGARAATGEIVVYTDDDVRLHPRWLERIVAAFDAPEITAVTGLVLPAELETDAQNHFETYWTFGRGFRRIDFGPDFFSTDRRHGCPAWQIGAGANMAFRGEVFQRIGLFDERLDVGQAGCSGDSEYWHRVLTHGGVCRYEPGAVVFHYHRRDLAGLSSQIYHYMRGHAAALMVQFERSGNWGNLRRALVSMPWWYAKRLVRGGLKGRTANDRFLGREIRGYLSGLRFYARAPRPGREGAAE
jgi:glycosyltransferase involved in cell wall biosynthesis